MPRQLGIDPRDLEGRSIRYAYPVTVERDEAGRFVATFPDVPEALTDGADEADLLRDLIRETWVQALDLSTLERVNASFGAAEARRCRGR